jgi:Tfp pilus assembly protein PilF
VLYEQVEAQAGSLVWAWKHLRIGMMHLVQDDFASALPHFRNVSEQMGPGPEKTIALLNLAHCYRALNRKQEAKLSYQAAMSLPNINWWEKAFEHWHPHEAHISNTKYEASVGLQKLSAK